MPRKRTVQNADDVDSSAVSSKRLKNAVSASNVSDDGDTEENVGCHSTYSHTDEQFKIVSWNVNGLRAVLRNIPFKEFLEKENAEVVCLSETKITKEKDREAPEEVIKAVYPHVFWNMCSTKNGYSGTLIATKTKPMSVRYGLGVSKHDMEGRAITVEFERFFVVNTYVPNSGQKLERLSYRTEEWDPAFREYLLELQKVKPIIVTGDLNCAREDIDIHNPKGNLRSAGFTAEEKREFARLLESSGKEPSPESPQLVDVFRSLYPSEKDCYTYWGYRMNLRAKNKGWRLDYFLTSSSLHNDIVAMYHLKHVTGSDHCPIALVLANSK